MALVIICPLWLLVLGWMFYCIFFFFWIWIVVALDFIGSQWQREFMLVGGHRFPWLPSPPPAGCPLQQFVTSVFDAKLSCEKIRYSSKRIKVTLNLIVQIVLCR